MTNPSANSSLDLFEAQRPRLMRLGYRMLGSVSEAEDLVQDAWLRWTRVEGPIDDAAGWLVRATTRLAIDRLRAAKVRREAYRGPWLPEPLIELDPVDPVERAEDVSVAFLLALERLSPLERAVFLLHDVFDEDYGKIADTLGRTEPAVRQLAARARTHVSEARPRFKVPQEEGSRLARAFMTAAATNDFSALSDLLAEDAVLISDGGGKRKAALRPLVGREDVLALLKGIAWRSDEDPDAIRYLPARINGWPGVIMIRADGPATMAFEPGPDGKLKGVYMVRNPDKLAHLPS